MPTGRTDELTKRFGAETTGAISTAYASALAITTGDSPSIRLRADQRLHLVEMLIDNVESGNVDPDSLKLSALVHVSRVLRACD